MIPYHWSLMKKLIWLKKAISSGAIWKTVTGSLIHITDALASPVNALSVNIDQVQSGSGDPSPDNVRPISGWKGAKVNRTGKNLLRLVSTEMTSSGWGRLFPISIPQGDYRISTRNQFGATSDKLGCRVRLLDVDGTAVKTIAGGSSYAFGNTGYSYGFSLTAEEAAAVAKISFDFRAAGATFATLADALLMIEVGDEKTDYEPYTGSVIPVSFGDAGTVYGGTLDVLSGVLTVERANIASYAGETLPGEWISDRDVYSPGATPTTGAQVVYKLAAPLSYQLTAQEVTTLPGENNIWADTGDTTVTYLANA